MRREGRTRHMRLQPGRGVAIILGLAVALVALGTARPAQAQQVCYAYDGLGRLTGVIDGTGQAAVYDYDAVGNVLAIRRPGPAGPVTIYSFDPPGGLPGDRVEVFGVGFGATANQNQVTIGGVPAPVVGTLPCTLVVAVPPDVVGGPISVTSPLGTGLSSQAFSPFSVAIPPTNPAILIGTTQQFSASVAGCPDPRVVWSVNGIVGGNATVGTITTTGLYTAPAVVPATSTVTIRADSVACAGLSAERTIVVVSELTGFVYAGASVSHGTPAPLFPVNTVMHAGSAVHGTPAPVLPVDTVLDSASVAYGIEPATTARDAVLHSASVANGPVISAVSPAGAARGTSVTVTITGTNLGGASGLTFLGTSVPDTTVTATGVVVDATGTTMTANVAVLATATPGALTVRVDHPGGNSTSVRTGVNVFTVAP